MYNYGQGNYGGYGSSYPNSVAASYGGLGQNSTPQNLQNSVFGYPRSSNAPYGNYGNSLMNAYAYNQQSNSSSLPPYTQHTTRGVMDAYATAASLNPSYGLSMLGNSVPGPVGYGRSGAGSMGGPGSKAAIPPPPYGAVSAKPKAPSSQYTGVGPAAYETAVYAAATSLFQAKAAGTANLWKKPGFGMSGRGGSQGFGSKRNYQTKDAQQFYCEICKISCAGQLTYKEHLEGQKHKKKEALAKGENNQSLPKSKVSFRCDLCNVTCTGQDTYNAHVRGTKHQKTLTLCKKLGKPIPSNEPTIIPPSDMGGRVPPPPPPPPPPPGAPGMAIPTVGGVSSAKRVVGISTVNFVQSSKLSTTGLGEVKKNERPGEDVTKDGGAVHAISSQSEELQALIAAEQSVQPVGEKYIEAEKDANGKLIQYICKLCECKFSDPNAKEIHLKGRRHRLQYKLKVDPSLEVEVKPQTARRGGRHNMPITRSLVPPMLGKPSWFGQQDRRNWFGAPYIESRRTDSIDEKHLQAKHAEIQHDEEYLTKIQNNVANIEATLKRISDHFNEKKNVDVSQASLDQRLLQGVMRVGFISNQLLLKDDKDLKLVVLCGEIPTREILAEVAQLFEEYFVKNSDKENTMKVEIRESESSVVLSVASCDLAIHVALTSRLFREESGEGAPLPADALDRDACLLALAQLRRSKWYQARCAYLQSCSQTLRIMRDLCKRNPAWSSLTDWMCELLVEKVLSSCPVPLSLSDAFRRVIEAVASGILSPIGPGLPDPCETKKPDALVSLSAQQREDIMQSAQHLLRLICFNQIFDVLGMERLPVSRPSPTDRKRPLDENNSIDEVKKDKKDEVVDEAPLKMEET